MQAATLAQTILAFDYGSKRVGVAVKPAGQAYAKALTTIDVNDQFWASLRALLRTQPADLLVVGWPRTADGNRSEQTVRAERFATELGHHTGMPTKLVDEFGSSERALALLPKGLPPLKARAILDQYAAQVILQDYLHEARH